MADVILPHSKVCTKCGQDKPLSEYHRKKSTRDGLQCRCKTCILEENAVYKCAHREESRAYNKIYYEQNREKILSYTSQWAKDNKDKVAETAKRWRQRHPERAKEVRDRYNAANVEKNRARCRRYREENHETFLAILANWRNKSRDKIAAYNSANYRENQPLMLARSAEWRRKNPDVVRAQCRARRAKRIGNGGSHTAEEARNLLLSQDCRCANPYCRVDLRVTEKHLDHMHPLARGGSDNIENLQWLCAPCNRRKHAKPMDEWLAAEARRSRKAA